MAKATTTSKTPAPAAHKAKATTTETERPAFDAKANKAKAIEERAARAAGKELKTERFTVAPGRSVLKGGQRYTEGEAIDLGEADGDRLFNKGDVAKGDAGAKDTKAKAQASADAEKATAEADEAQRLADEAAAREKAAQDAADGKLSGAENR